MSNSEYEGGSSAGEYNGGSSLLECNGGIGSVIILFKLMSLLDDGLLRCSILNKFTLLLLLGGGPNINLLVDWVGISDLGVLGTPQFIEGHHTESLS